MIYDTETHDHWTIVYSLEDYPDGAKVKDSATVGTYTLLAKQSKASGCRMYMC